MTAKDYVAMAAIIHRRLRATRYAEGRYAIECLAAEFALHFGFDNARFDSDRFYTACGLDPVEMQSLAYLIERGAVT